MYAKKVNHRDVTVLKDLYLLKEGARVTDLESKGPGPPWWCTPVTKLERKNGQEGNLSYTFTVA